MLFFLQFAPFTILLSIRVNNKLQHFLDLLHFFFSLEIW